MTPHIPLKQITAVKSEVPVAEYVCPFECWSVVLKGIQLEYTTVPVVKQSFKGFLLKSFQGIMYSTRK